MPDLAAARESLAAFADMAGRPLEPWKAGALELEVRITVIVAPRQSGKSLSLAVLALWWAFRRPGQRVLLVSPERRPHPQAARAHLRRAEGRDLLEPAPAARPGPPRVARLGRGPALRRLLEGRPVGRYATAADRMAAFGRPRRGRRSQGARKVAA